jgi:hypothetical protein
MGIGNIPPKSPAPKMDSIGGVAGDPKATQSTTPQTETENPPEALQEGVGKKLNIPNC